MKARAPSQSQPSQSLPSSGTALGDEEPDPKRRLLNDAVKRLAQMKSVRQPWCRTWQEITHYIVPERGRYQFLSESQRVGFPKGARILDRTATIGVGNLAAFLMAGITSPAREWFRLSTSLDDINDNTDVKEWLAEATSRLQRVYATSNFYQAMAQLYEEIVAFGTGVVVILQDYDDVVRFYCLTAGEYYIAQDHRMEVQTLIRCYNQTPDQIVEKFGLENCSLRTQQLHSARQFTTDIRINHVIMPNPYHLPRAMGWQGRKWLSFYFEEGEKEKLLGIEGYPGKPFIAPRWHVVSNDPYGHGPGADVLPDVKSLQKAQLVMAEVIDKTARPPMMADAMLQGALINLMPSGVNYIPGLNNMGNGAGLRPVYQTSQDIASMQGRVSEFQDQIRKGLKNDLILMVSEMDGQPVTAAEINVRQQEKLLALGPVLERFHNEALNPVINATLAIMEHGGLLPQRPEALKGANIHISYVSVLAQAQRATETTSLEQLGRFVGGWASVKPDIIDMLQLENMIRQYADLLGVDVRNLTNPEQLAALQQQRAQSQQNQQDMQTAMMASQGAKTLSETELGGGQNALGAIMGMGQ